MNHRSLRAIAGEIKAVWPGRPASATYYMYEMGHVDSVDCRRYEHDGRHIVRQFLLYSCGWIGEDAMRIRCELKKMIGIDC